MQKFWISTFAAFCLAGCATTIDHRPLSKEEFYQVDFQTLVPERWWGDFPPPNVEENLKSFAAAKYARHGKIQSGSTTEIPIVNMLVLSGGSADGAFGVGILSGWTESGQRPEFDYVTGISTGALIAPLAFLGSAYDEMLSTAYTSIDRSMVFRLKGLAGFLWGSSLADTKPLEQLLDQYITPDVVKAIAAEHERGRVLSVLTTQLDALRPTVW
ncbi:MAG: patatin-like phospholipase family protein, partial [Kordiimonadaceae bacterium]|nr:patatin-like phospholipase family protein [Kordiimonadaceae bacterium]